MNYEHLLQRVELLKLPNYHELNKHSGRNDRLMHAVLCAYAKHVLSSDDIGWDELGDILHNAISNEIENEALEQWAEQI